VCRFIDVILEYVINNIIYYILYNFAWKPCIFIGLQEDDILACQPLKRVTICLSVILM